MIFGFLESFIGIFCLGTLTLSSLKFTSRWIPFWFILTHFDPPWAPQSRPNENTSILTWLRTGPKAKSDSKNPKTISAYAKKKNWPTLIHYTMQNNHLRDKVIAKRNRTHSDTTRLLSSQHTKCHKFALIIYSMGKMIYTRRWQWRRRSYSLFGIVVTECV